MDQPEIFPPSMVLGRVADHLLDHHSDLRVALPTHNVTYEEALAATTDCLRGLSDRILLPTTNPARRQALRIQALENTRLSEDPLSPSRPIRTTATLSPEDCPKPLSPDRRALLKKKLTDENAPRESPTSLNYVLCSQSVR